MEVGQEISLLDDGVVAMVRCGAMCSVSRDVCTTERHRWLRPSLKKKFYVRARLEPLLLTGPETGKAQDRKPRHKQTELYGIHDHASLKM